MVLPKSVKVGWIALFVLLWGVSPAAGQKVIDKSSDRDARRVYARIKGLDIGMNMGYVAPTEAFLRGDNMYRKPVRSFTMGHIKLFTQARRGSREDILYGSPYIGGGAFFSTFRHKYDLGRPWGVYLLQGARIAMVSSRVSFNYEWNFGLSGGWKKYDPVSNPLNHVIGTPLNAYLNANFFFSWIISRSFNLNAGLSVTHFSNGNTTVPNAGINIIGGYVGVRSYFNRDYDLYRRYPKQKMLRSERNMSYELLLYASCKSLKIDAEEMGVSPYFDRKFFVGGISFSPMYQLGHKVRLGGSLDLSYDESAGTSFELGPYGQVVARSSATGRHISVGVAAKVDFVMPVITLSGSVGYNLLNADKRIGAVYQILALKFHVSRSIFLNVGYRTTSFRYPNSLMLGAGCRFGRNR